MQNPQVLGTHWVCAESGLNDAVYVERLLSTLGRGTDIRYWDLEKEPLAWAEGRSCLLLVASVYH